MITDLKIRTKKFAHSCVKLASELTNSKLAYHIQGQLIRCSTSVAANYRSSCIAQSKKSFIAKISIVVEEVDESNFWLNFIKDEKLQSNYSLLEELIQESAELTSIFIASRKTAKQNILKEDEVIYETKQKDIS